MSRSELAKVVTILDSAANKRLKRLAQAPMGTESIAYQNVMEIGKFSVKGKNQGQLQAEYKRVKQFLSGKTSTARGWNQFRAETLKRIGGGFADEQREKDFWKIYRDLEKSDQRALIKFDSTQAQKFMHSEWDRKRVKALTDAEQKQFKELFPEDKRPLFRISDVEKVIIRTMIKQELHYREKMEEEAMLGVSDGLKIDSRSKI